MTFTIQMAPLRATRLASCDYGHFFSFVPGDPANPLVAIWQADLAQTLVLLGVGFALLWMSRQRTPYGGRVVRLVSQVVLLGAIASGVLTGVTAVTSTRLACGGTPGVAPGSAADLRAYQAFHMLNTLSIFMAYVALLLLVAALVTGLLKVARHTGQPTAPGSQVR